jgi:type VI secretion system protein ImpL
MSDIVGGGVPQMKSPRTIRGAFTKECFEGVIGKQLKNGVKISDGWVLGPGLAASNPTIATEQVSSLYFEQYIAEWRKFLESVELEQSADLHQLLDLMETLTGTDPPPMARLLGKVALNTRIASLLSFDIGSGPASERKFTAKEVQTEFDGFAHFGGFDKALVALPGSAAPPPAGLDKYQQILHTIHDAVRADIDNPQGGRTLITVLQTATTQVDGQLGGLRLGWWQQPCLKKLLLTPIKVAEGAEVRQIVKDLNQKWCSSVHLDFSRTLAGRYPFDPRGADAALADVAAYFGPQGTLWTFYDKNLANDLQRMGGSFQPASPIAGQVFGPGFIEHLARAQEISTALFPPNGKDVLVGFAVNVHPSTDFDLVRLNVNGQTVEYHNGPATWPQLKWPTEGNSSGASLAVHSIKGESEEISAPGEWGFFRLLEQGKLKGRDIAAFTMTWKFPKIAGAPEVTMDVRPARTQTPFLSPSHPGERTGILLHPFRGAEVAAPATVGNGPAACQ